MFEPLVHTLSITAIAIWVYMTLWFLVSVMARRNDVADIAWGPGFIVVSITSLLVSHNVSPSTLLVLALVTIWGLRLGLHIGARNIHKSEDSRYQIKRRLWGNQFYVRSYFQIFILQGALILLVASPIIILNTFAASNFNWLIVVGAVLWIIGFSYESLADRQLHDFISDPSNKGRVMRSGLWRYSRHPNYFGELTQWWAIGIIVLSSAYGWLGLIGPLLISYLIIKVSGIPLLEKKYADNLEYQAYKLHTRALLPLPPRIHN